MLTQRYCLVQHDIDELSANQRRKDRLLKCGYAPQLFDDDDISVTVTVDTVDPFGREYRTRLIKLFTGYQSILESIDIDSVVVDCVSVDVDKLFVIPSLHSQIAELSLEQLQGRRAVCCRLIDEYFSCSTSNSANKNDKQLVAHVNKMSLLEAEQQLETEFNCQQNRNKQQSKRFLVTLQRKFFDCVLCCGDGISGCYAPNGVHAEKPLEIGLRVDAAIVSVVDEDHNTEIENAEIVFTDQGAFIYKSYTYGTCSFGDYCMTHN